MTSGSERQHGRQGTEAGKAKASWSSRYGARHRLQRVRGEALGVALPKRVRIYHRQDHFVLQYWDTGSKSNQNVRVDGDLITAIAKAREIEERLTVRGSQGVSRRIKLTELVERFLADLTSRANARELAVASERRMASALRHVRQFLETTSAGDQYAWAQAVDREFRLQLTAFLGQQTAIPDQPRGRSAQRLVRVDYVLDCCRAMFAWAADPRRGRLLPEGFFNPFQERGGRSSAVRQSLVGEPDITTAMAVDLLQACDAFQLPLLGTILLCGLRPSEATYLFHEQCGDGWLNVQCLPQLGYFTKGRTDKRFPAVGALKTLLKLETVSQGLLFTRRSAAAHPDLVSLDALQAAFVRRCQAHGQPTAAVRERLRDELIREAGGLDYDRIEHEFRGLARSLAWPKSATLKDLRHLFGTCVENAGVPELYRKFLMGHSLGRAPIVGYTHLNAIQRHYQRALDTELAPFVAAIERRAADLHRDGTLGQERAQPCVETSALPASARP